MDYFVHKAYFSCGFCLALGLCSLRVGTFRWFYFLITPIPTKGKGKEGKRGERTTGTKFKETEY